MENQIPLSHNAWGKRNNKVMNQTLTGFTKAYAQTVNADCDLDLWPSDMVLACNTFSCLDDIIIKSHHAGWSYGLSTPGRGVFTSSHSCTPTSIPYTLFHYRLAFSISNLVRIIPAVSEKLLQTVDGWLVSWAEMKCAECPMVSHYKETL